MSVPTEQAATVMVSRKVKPGCEKDFERVAHHLIAIASRAPGYLGAHLILPGEEEGADDFFCHVVLAFDTQANMQAWQHSAERAEGLAAAVPFIEGSASHRQVPGLELWFRSAFLPAAPPRWKVAAMTWLGLFPTVYVLFRLSWNTLSAWPLLPRLMVLTMTAVILMTWVVAPAMARLLRPWLLRGSASR